MLGGDTVLTRATIPSSTVSPRLSDSESANNHFSQFQLGRFHLNSTLILIPWEGSLKLKRTKDSNFIIFKFPVDLVRPVIDVDDDINYIGLYHVLIYHNRIIQLTHKPLSL